MANLIPSLFLSSVILSRTSDRLDILGSPEISIPTNRSLYFSSLFSFLNNLKGGDLVNNLHRKIQTYSIVSSKAAKFFLSTANNSLTVMSFLMLTTSIISSKTVRQYSDFVILPGTALGVERSSRYLTPSSANSLMTVENNRIIQNPNG